MGAADDDVQARLLGVARELAPRIQALAEQIERERQLPRPLVDALAEAGLFRMLLPKTADGSEVDPVTFARVIEEVAKADASTAWCLSQASGCSMVAAYLTPSVAWEIFGRDPDAVLAWGPGPTARAVAVAGGYRVTGEWGFASGCRHATWLGGVCPIVEPDGTPRRRPDGTTDARTMLFPAARADLVDVWRVSGLRGTGSDTIKVEDLFVPQEYSARPDGAERREAGPLYLFQFNNLFAPGFASVALGIARSTLDAFVDLALTKTPRGYRSPLRESALVQAQVAQAEAQWRSARAFLHGTLAEVWEAVCRANALALEQRVLIRLAATYAIHQAAQVVDTAYHAAGATAIFDANPFERRFRDMHAVTQQVQGRQAHYETVGRFLLGLEPDQGFL